MKKRSHLLNLHPHPPDIKKFDCGVNWCYDGEGRSYWAVAWHGEVA